MPFSTVRTALSSAKNVSRRVIKPVGVLVFTESHIFIPMHDFDTPVLAVESQYLYGIRFFTPINSGVGGEYHGTTSANLGSDEETREILLRATAVHAPIAWGHINMLGVYDFAEEKLKDAAGILPRNLSFKTAPETGGRDLVNLNKNSGILEMAWRVSHLCPGGTNDILMRILPF